MSSSASKLLLLVMFSLLTGCASARDRAVQALNGVDVLADNAHSILATDTKRAYQGCLDASGNRAMAMACGERVQAKYQPAWDAYRITRRTWLLLAASIQAAEAAGREPSQGEMAVLLGKLAQNVIELKDALEKAGAFE